MKKDPDIVATIDASFQNVLNLSASMMNLTNSVNVDLNSSYPTGGANIIYNTSEYWNSHPTLISKRGYIYVYSDWAQDSQGRDVAGLKVGDGQAYLIDLPFTEQILIDHLNDMVRHITEEERTFWNNKVRCYMDTEDRIVFTTD